MTTRTIGTTSESPWLVNPALDLAFGCGGAVWILFILHFIFLKGSMTNPASELLLAISATGAIIFAETHTITTLVTVYKNRANRNRYRLYTKWLGGICLGLILLGCLNPAIAPVYLKIYLLFVPHHFMNQCYGIALLYCVKRGYKPGNLEKLALKLFTTAVAWYAVLRQLSYPTWSGKTLLNTEIPFWSILPRSIPEVYSYFLYLATALMIITILEKILRGKEILPLPAQLTILTGTLAFTLGPAASGIYWLYVSAFFHGTQYLMIATARHVRELDRKEKHPLFNAPALKFLVLSFLISLTIYIVMPNLSAHIGMANLKIGVILFAIVNLFHFITDSGIWKLRDSKTRSLLANQST